MLFCAPARALQVRLLRRARLAYGLASRAQPGGGLAAADEDDADWKTLLALTTSPEIKRKIGHLKGDLLALQEQQLEALNPKDPEPTHIDWDDWKTKLEPGVVDMFRAALQRLRIPRYVPSYEAVDAMFEPILDDARALEAQSARRVVELEAELAKVDAELANMPRLTMEDEWEANPDIAAEVDKEIDEYKWF